MKRSHKFLYSGYTFEQEKMLKQVSERLKLSAMMVSRDQAAIPEHDARETGIPSTSSQIYR